MIQKLVKLLLVLLLPFVGQTQEQSTSVILKKLSKAKDDSSKIELLKDLELALFDVNLDSNISINQQIILLCDKNLKKEPNSNFYLDSKSYSLNNLGIGYQYKGEIKKALDMFEKSLQIDLKRGDKRSIAASYSNIGIIYDYFGDYIKAIAYYEKSLKLQKEVKNDKGISDIYNNFGVIYGAMKDNERALNYYFASLAIDRKMKAKDREAITLGNIGFIYQNLNQLDKAIYYTKKALEINEKVGNETNIAVDKGNLGSLYLEKNELQKARVYIEDAILLFRKNENKQKLASFLPYLARLEFKLGNLSKAHQLANEAYRYSIESHDKLSQKNSAQTLYEISKKQNNNSAAIFYLEEVRKLEQELVNDENKKQLLGFEFEKKSVEDSLKNAGKIQLKTKELSYAKRENQLNKERIIYLFLGLIILVVLVIFVFNRFQVTKRQKQTILLQQQETEKQKHIIEEKQKEINDSINYAVRIQESFLASELLFKENLTDYFILFKPKDVVSGDFYWGNFIDNQFFLCVADSTGHGIPGAFMSLLNISLLNEALLSKTFKEPNQLFDFVRKILILGLKPDESGQGGNDGMDAACVRIDQQTKRLTYTGANNPLWIIRGTELIELKADKMPVGRSPKQEIPFTLQEVELQKNDCIYLFSDGYADQFGGPKGKKFKYKALEELLLEIASLSMHEQKNRLEQTFSNWKGALEQVDDVCIIGVRV